MEIHQIRYFLAVAETLNFTRAAERSCISQPALTKAIQRLEETIGGRLFDRTKSSVQLTELGLAMLPKFRQIYDGVLQMRDQARQMIDGQPEAVRIGVMCTIDFQKLLPGFLDDNKRQIDVEYVFLEGNLEALFDALDRGGINLGVMCSPYGVPDRFVAHTLFREEFVIAFGASHRFNGRHDIEISELHQERYCDRLMCEFSTYIDRLLREREVHLEVVQQSAREDWIQALVHANFGVSFMPVSLAKNADLGYVRISDVSIVREVNVLVHTESEVTARQQKVIDGLMAYTW